ncbi:MAG: hypothetical protein IE881_06630 [Epsilonproteobacteria bacterium]|nr:hypothetical protein [Campylobacterota bacterium]
MRTIQIEISDSIFDRVISFLGSFPKGLLRINENIEKDKSIDETEYLMSSPANAQRLLESIKNIKRGKGLEKALIECD